MDASWINPYLKAFCKQWQTNGNTSLSPLWCAKSVEFMNSGWAGGMGENIKYLEWFNVSFLPQIFAIGTMFDIGAGFYSYDFVVNVI